MLLYVWVPGAIPCLTALPAASLAVGFDCLPTALCCILLPACRHTDSPWIFSFPKQLVGTPKKGAKAMGSFFEEVSQA